MFPDLLIEAIAGASARLNERLSGGISQASLGLRRAARLPSLAALWQLSPRPILLITDRADHALALADELALWLTPKDGPAPARLVFPEPNPLFYEQAAWGENTRRERLQTLTALAAYHIPGASPPPNPPVIVASARALMTRTLPRREFLTATRSLRAGQKAGVDELVRAWVALGYEPVNIVIAPGQLARRGGILDFWPSAETQPVRLEFFGDEIDTLRRFDPATQRTIKEAHPLERILVTPAREYLATPERVETLHGARQGKTPTGVGDSNSPLSAGFAAHASGGGAGGVDLPPDISEFHLPLLHTAPAGLLDYLPRQALVLVDDLQALHDAVSEIEEQAVNLRRDYTKEGILPADFPVPYLTWSELNDALAAHQSLELADSSGAWQENSDEAALAELLAVRFMPGPRFGGRLKPVMEHMVERYQAGEQVVVVSRQAARLKELWAESRPAGDGAAIPSIEPVLVEGSLSEGWVFTPKQGGDMHLLTDGEIFGWRRPESRRRRRPAAEPPESPYSDLQPGDWVVHVDHGIGQFKGLVNRTVEGLEREYLCVEYADEAQLFVPIHQVDRLTRYVGPEGRSPSPSRLGAQEWKSAKNYVKEAVQEVAEDLLELYARRSVVQGNTFQPDTHWQQELEASFPYVETDDQMRVLAEVKHDMESPRPMDRLICGDVGYGKTEVALRAAFKAVNDGKQVAVLVPTTVLAQQHYNTFTQRLAPFPVEVEMLSRFRSPQQQREILQRLTAGAVDILIGTHRMLSQDVLFKDLGLLIIDEEQRFGVTHKEALKQIRTEVDVLTLTATPIPRTLYMALSGVRDISTINTPPEERLPIITHVGPYSPRLVRQAILREMERGGQVFFVHNRVQTIGAMRNHLEKLVPEARVAVAHGQMAEGELAKRMESFTNGDVDVLLSTSIIESGLDIPSANTLIVDRADTFGLAQLYQLRGRVGRGAQRAYAYFFRHNKIAPTQEARQRLETIAENTQLGAGFSIAMRDLEIRGTGDILGARQHGNIATVGFHLYTRLLAEAVRKLRQTRSLPPAINQEALNALSAPLINANIELPLPVGIPADYVADRTMRLGLYRRLAGLRSDAEIDAIQGELRDRFGDPPRPVRNLLYQLKVKLLAEQAGLTAIGAENGQLALRFPDNELPERLPDLDPLVRAGKVALWLPYQQSEDWQAQLLDTLQRLAAHARETQTSPAEI